MDHFEEDHSAIGASANNGAALCTIVNIDGSFSRRLGAQLAINPDGSIVGSLSDGCLAHLIHERGNSGLTGMA